MSVSIETNSSALSVARIIKALAAGENSPHGALAFAEGAAMAWNDTPRVNMILRTAVGANSTAAGSGAELAYARSLFNEFIGLLRPRTIADRVTGWRKTPMNVSTLKFTADATGAVVAEGASTPVSKFSLARVTLSIQKVAAIVIATTEVMRSNSNPAEVTLASELARAVGLATDSAMFDVDTVGSIANSGTVIVSAGNSLANIDSDLQRMTAYFNSTDAGLDDAVFVMAPQTATYLGSLRGTGGAAAFPNVGARGGSILQIPVFVSGAMSYSGSPSASQITLFSPSQVLLADPNAIEIQTSEQTTIQMDSAATEHSVTPTATSSVSMFDCNCVAVGARRWISWALANATACVTMKVAY